MKSHGIFILMMRFCMVCSVHFFSMRYCVASYSEILKWLEHFVFRFPLLAVQFFIRISFFIHHVHVQFVMFALCYEYARENNENENEPTAFFTFMVTLAEFGARSCCCSSFNWQLTNKHTKKHISPSLWRWRGNANNVCVQCRKLVFFSIQF